MPDTEALCSITGLVEITTEFVVFVPIETLDEAALCSLHVAVAFAVIVPPVKFKPVFVQTPLETVVVPNDTPLLKI